jgi:D-arabinose 5-phosphate isomerase GutQ
MWNIDDIKKKREMYERKIEDVLKEFEKEIPPEFKIESAVVIRGMGKSGALECHIKLEVADINK